MKTDEQVDGKPSEKEKIIAFNTYIMEAEAIESHLYAQDKDYARHEKIEMDEQPFKMGYDKGHASGKIAGRQEAIDEMAGKVGEGFEGVYDEEWETPPMPINSSAEEIHREVFKFFYAKTRTPLLARIKRLEMDARESDDWREHNETKLKNRIKALEGELLKMWCRSEVHPYFPESKALDYPLAAELAKQEKP